MDRHEYKTQNEKRDTARKNKFSWSCFWKWRPSWWWTPTDRFGFFVAFFTGALVLVAYWQLTAMNRQVNEMKAQRVITIAQTRANLARQDLKRQPVNEVVNGKPTDGWAINPVWKNVGSTNATNFLGWFDIDVLDTILDVGTLHQSICPAPAKPTPMPHPGVIAAEGRITQTSKFISRQDAIAANTSQKFIFVVGHVEYRDIYYPETPIHHDDWCILLLPNNIAQDVWSPLNVSESVN